MKRIIALMVCFYTATVSFASEPVSETLQLEQDFKQAQSKSQRFSKSQVIIFSAKWCAPCTQLQESTLKDPALVNYLNESSVNTIVDIDTKDGFQLMSKFNVKVLPTIIITDFSGNEIARKKTFMTSEEFQKFVSANCKPQSAKNNGAAIAPCTEQKIKTNEIPVTSENIIPAVSENNNSKSNKSVASKTSAAGSSVFGVQIGVYSSLEIALSEIARLQKVLPGRDILILNRNDGSQTQIRLIIGAYVTRELASSIKEDLKKADITGFVKDLTSI